MERAALMTAGFPVPMALNDARRPHAAVRRTLALANLSQDTRQAPSGIKPHRALTLLPLISYGISYDRPMSDDPRTTNGGPAMAPPAAGKNGIAAALIAVADALRLIAQTIEVNEPVPGRGLTLAETAKELGVSEASVRNLVHSGALKAERHGPRFYRVTPADLAAYRKRITKAEGL